MNVGNKELTIQGVSFDFVGACDVVDMVRLETLKTDNGTLFDGHRVAEVNTVRDSRANISQRRSFTEESGTN